MIFFTLPQPAAFSAHRRIVPMRLVAATDREIEALLSTPTSAVV